MSGHSKWSSIKHKKAAKDARRGKLFTKLIKEITVAAKTGGGDVDANPRLRAAVSTARANSMPGDNIEKAIKKGTGELEGVDYVDITYEGYGPGGVAVMLECLTDNKNRTVAEIRHLFSKNGGNLGETNCVAWMFEKQGQITVDAGDGEDRIFEVAVEAGASDVLDEGTSVRVVTPVESLEEVRGRLEKAGSRVEGAEVVLEPKSFVALTGGDAAKVLKLIDALEDHDDVQRVSANFEIDDDELSRLSA